jgi:hypothetical protein
MTRTGEPRQTEATQDRDEDLSTNPDFAADTTEETTENLIIITITNFS